YFVPPAKAAVDGMMHNFHFLGAVFVSTILLMLLIGVVKPRETPYVQQPSGAVDLTPWKPAWFVGLGLVLVVFAIYAAFADVSVIGP
ncbi:MAG: solute:sodium symporter family transporter, partial [Planctomycetaceae bacterium]|nr:solute:sodium symporter family transporter [Planctomycetaceae bacterium]